MILTDTKYHALSAPLLTKLKQFKNDRTSLEQQMLRNLRQYRGKYDPEIETVLDDPQHASRSKVYPRDTRVKVGGFVAKMMEMMFPATEKNWALNPTPYPNVSENDIRAVVLALRTLKQQEYERQAQEAQAAQQGGSPLAVPAAPEPVTSEEIEIEVQALAAIRAANMEKEIEDQLADIGGERVEYAQLVKKVLRSAAIYGFGAVEGPLIREQEERTWVPSGDTFVPQAKKKLRPYFEQVKVWDLFPDLSAKEWRGQTFIFRRRVFLKKGLQDLVKRKDFEPQRRAILEFIKENPDGNYVSMTYESELDTVNNTSNIVKDRKGRFEVYRALGYLPSEDLKAAGVEVKEGATGDVLADIWLLGDLIMKAEVAAFGTNPADSFGVFVYEDDEESGLTGVGLPEILRDSQMRLCAIDRATMDNAASVAGPVWERNRALLGRGGNDGPIHSFKVIERDDDNPQTAGIQAVRQLSTNAYINEYLALRETVKQILDYESNLPSILMGDPSRLGEAFRTSSNMSMMTGAANMITKDVVRSFDRFTVQVIGALVQWNMEFNDKPEIKGDYQVQPKGSLSLVAKEVRGAALDQLWQTMDEEDKALVDRVKVLRDRFKSRDLPAEYIVDDERAREILDNRARAAAEAAGIEQGLTRAKSEEAAARAQEIMRSIDTKLESMAADITQKLTQAKGEKDRVQLEHIKLLLESLVQREGGRGTEGTGGKKGRSGGRADKGASGASTGEDKGRSGDQQ